MTKKLVGKIAAAVMAGLIAVTSCGFTQIASAATGKEPEKYTIRLEQKLEREQVAKVTGTNKDDSGVKAPVKRDKSKVYPNDPCPCGSGKKYKNCCGLK